jgi:hypothetical protein
LPALRLSLRLCVKLFRYAFELDEPTEPRNHHSFFTLETARECGAVALLVLPLQVIPDLAIRTLAIPAKVAVRDRVEGQVLETPQQAILLGYADFFADYLNADQLLVRIEEIALFTHSQRQYNRSLLKFVQRSIAGVSNWL